MELFLSQLINGLSIGQVYALIALGFSLIFGVANIINFAQGAMFMLGAFIAFSGLTWLSLPIWAAVALSVAVVSGIGVIIDRIAVRPLAGGPLVAPLLSTLAVGIMIEQFAEIIWTPDSQSFPAPFGGVSFVFGNAFITGADILITCVGLASLLVLTYVITRTWTGRALRAVAQDSDAAAQNGVDVDRTRQIAFALAGGVGALSGILAAFYFQSVFPQMGLPFGMKGFAAAILGGISSLPGAVVGGLLLGMMETLASAYLGEGYRDTVAFSLLLLLLVFRPAGLFGDRRLEALGGSAGAGGTVPTTSLMAEGSSTRARIRSIELPPFGFLLIGLLMALLPLVTESRYIIQAVSGGLIFALLAVSVTLASGTAGILSLGHAAFYGTGAYIAAIAAKTYGWPVEAVLPAAAFGAAIVAAFAAIPLLRLSGHTVALGTLAVGQIGALVFLNWISVTRGPMGIPSIPQAWLASFDSFRFGGFIAKYYGILVVTMLGIALASRLTASPLGRIWRAIREDRLAAHTAGVPVSRYIILVFAASGFLAGLAGALFAYLQTVVSPESFTVETSILILIMAVLGGLGNITGAMVTGFALAVVPELLRGFDDYRMIVYGLLLLLTLRLRPQGLFGAR